MVKLRNLRKSASNPLLSQNGQKSLLEMENLREIITLNPFLSQNMQKLYLKQEM